MGFKRVNLKPGVYKDDSPLEDDGYWIDTNKIRFVRGLPETIYGWERASTTALLGYCRGAFQYADNSRNPYAAFGTNLRLYTMDLDGNVTDTTPWVSRGYTSFTFTTTITSAVVTMGWTSHGLIADQKFTLESPSVSTVGGVTIAGTYVVLSVTDANTITLTAAQAASANAGPTASVCLWTTYLAPGQADGIGGLGFGTGAYGSGGYASATSGLTYYPRTWSLDTWGQNLISNPRGGGIYEWAPNVTASELVTNGSFTGSATGWTTGAGWAYGTNNVIASGAGGTLSQSITLAPGAWYRATANATTFTSGVANLTVGGSYIGTTISATGISAHSFFSGSGGAKTFAVQPATSINATFDDISVQVETYSNIITGAPTQVTCTFVTAERILVACGCPSDITGRFDGSFDAMRVAWTDTQNNQTWTPAGTNLAGSYTLSNGSRIVRGLPGNGMSLILTDTAATSMRYTGDPTSVYSFTEVGTNCGLIGPNAVAEVGGTFYWMDPSGGFWKYDGSYPEPLLCTLNRDVKDNLAWVQQDKIYAFAVTTSGRNEVWWLYPDFRDGNECSRYVAYGITESSTTGFPVWWNGTFDRTAWVNAGAFQYPLAVDLSGAIWFQEKGLSADGAARSWSAVTGYRAPDPDGGHVRILGIESDVEDQQGGFSITINARIRNSTSLMSRSFGPYNVLASAGKTSVRANGQEFQYAFAGTSSPVFWRMGAFREKTEPTGRQR